MRIDATTPAQTAFPNPQSTFAPQPERLLYRVAILRHCDRLPSLSYGSIASLPTAVTTVSHAARRVARHGVVSHAEPPTIIASSARAGHTAIGTRRTFQGPRNRR